MPLSFLKSTPPALPFDYQIVRSARRRSISIEIAKAQVVVRAPFFVATSDVEKFIYEKANWVQQKLTQQAQQISTVPVRSFVDGSQLPYLDHMLTLVVRKLSDADVVRYGDKLLVVLSSRSRLDDAEQSRRLVMSWLQTQALHLLSEKTEHAARAINARVANVSIKATRAKWGHCTTQGDIQYNWQILLAPEAIVDYLVAHEVSHLLHHNHSPAFWAVVARLCPDYKKRRAWLKANSMHLMI